MKFCFDRTSACDIELTAEEVVGLDSTDVRKDIIDRALATYRSRRGYGSDQYASSKQDIVFFAPNGGFVTAIRWHGLAVYEITREELFK